MLDIEKKQSHSGYYFIISTNEGKFQISFEGNLDLYWRYLHEKSILDEPESKSFTITKENSFLYSLFENLYKDIREYNIYKVDEFDLSRCKSLEELDQLNQQKRTWNSNLKRMDSQNPERLFLNNAIEWHCDDFPYEESSVVKIEKKKDTFIVTFEKSKSDSFYPFLTYSVRFRNSGSRYEPFNLIFMDMYNKLIDYESDYHQIHIEEYLYQKKLEKKK